MNSDPPLQKIAPQNPKDPRIYGSIPAALVRGMLPGYKVVSKYGDNYHSATFHSDLVYTPYERTYPYLNQGPLCVFKLESEAAFFAKDNAVWLQRELIIFHCWYVSSKLTTLWTDDDNRAYLDTLAYNTALADAVMITEEVK